MARKQLPNEEIESLNGKCFTGEVVKGLSSIGRPKTPKDLEELDQRFKEYLEYCAENNFRVGIESMCLAFGVSRQTFWNWCNGINCDSEWQNACGYYRQYVIAFIEQAETQGKLNPVSAIFLKKNLAGYKDQQEYQEAKSEKRVVSLSEVASLIESLD